jgi:hypothetical protein
MRSSLLAVGLLASVAPAALAAPVPPQAGTYLMYSYVESATCSISVTPPTPDTPQSRVAVYPGPGAKGFTLYDPTYDATGTDIITLPVTPTSAGPWSGTATDVHYPGGKKHSIAFTATVTYATASTFLLSATIPADCTDRSTGTKTTNFVLTFIAP